MALSSRTIFSGFALATSWTWCIGMFAPILMGQLFGWPGILVFALPNIIGCACFGYLRTAERSRQETRDHAWVMGVFSAATVAYQVFFAGWQWGPIVAEQFEASSNQGTALVTGALFTASVLLAALPRHLLWPLAALAFPLSLLTFAFLPWGSMHAISARGAWTMGDLALVAPTIVFGFLLSPNLDLTFHRARQECHAGERPRNFAVFGVAFAAMLLLTTCYLAASPGGLNNPAVRAHMAIQLVMTCALHLSELRFLRLPVAPRMLLGVGAGILGLIVALVEPGRDSYLRFLGLYGLLFPAYAALALRAKGRPTVRAALAVGVAVIAVTPILDHAFLDRPTMLAPLAVVFPLVAIVLFTRRGR